MMDRMRVGLFAASLFLLISSVYLFISEWVIVGTLCVLLSVTAYILYRLRIRQTKNEYE